MGKAKIPLNKAESLAERIKEALAPGCHRIEIAGSIRRKRPTIGDIEIVCIPKRQENLFGEQIGPSLLDVILDGLISSGRLWPEKNGEKYKQFEVSTSPGLYLDLFITTPESWAVIFAIRTGSASFTKKLVTQKRKGGLLDDSCSVSDARVWRNGHPVDLAEERDFLALAGGWIRPEDRY